MNNTTYYQKNREVILNRAKDHYENDKQEINIETYLKKIKRKRENMEKIDIIICLKKKKQKLKEYQKKYQEAKKSKNNNE